MNSQRKSSRVVSVVIPAYNRCDFVAGAVDSVLSQTYGMVEVIVVDDGSTDGTGALIQQRYAHESRVRYVWQQNAERAAARNRGMQEARGEFIAFLDSDDRWLPDKLTHQMPGFSDPEVGVSYTGCIIEHVGFGKGSAFVRRLREGETTGDIVEYLTYMNVMGGAFSQVVRRELIDKVGGFNIDPFLIPFAEDWEYWIRLCSHTKVAYIAEPLVVHRIHDQNTEQPVGPNTYGRMIIKVLSYSGRKGAALTIRAARRRYRLMNAEALHVNNWGAFVMAYLWAIRVTGWGFAWEDVRTLLWRARGGRARLKKAQDHHSVQNPPEAERGPSTRRSGDRQQKENIP